MAQNGDFNIGRDATLQIVLPDGSALQPTLLTEFTEAQEVTELESKPLNGPPIFANVPKGWKGTFKYDRASSALDDYISSAEDDYWDGVDQIKIFIIRTVKELDGSLSQYRHEGVVLRLEDSGTWKQDDRVQQTLAYRSTRRRKVA